MTHIYCLLVLAMFLLVPSASAAQLSFGAQLDLANEGDKAAMVAVAKEYLRGEQVERDCFEARRWFKRGAELGSVEAQFQTGLIIDNGVCGIADAEAAFGYYSSAAAQGHAAAQYHLGVLYQTGRAGTRDDEQAVAWFRKAVRSGEPLAYCGLALAYAKGDGVARDRKEAKKLAQRGITSRHQEAVELCSQVIAEQRLGE